MATACELCGMELRPGQKPHLWQGDCVRDLVRENDRLKARVAALEGARETDTYQPAAAGEYPIRWEG